ncbi:hypothetical protein [endosymbiont GvMRE of Glomus versiforme]|uniref:hypothetical protein n=1 Tax=endosymbiont GvMRE of Glomus versiforme TaxID=2039283 RepID=UPI000EBE11D8|nr:hypothetical protein [endosymbiont GvMRE of Glomus versiforme]RHZ37714.1 hypothetical protein GvMRE_I1g520 [endosymbiont GvMRE of Glomus versiforme]
MEDKDMERKNKKMKIIGYHWPLAARGHYPNEGMVPIYDWNDEDKKDLEIWIEK